MIELPWVTRHACERSAERLGRPLTRAEWVSIGNQIIVAGAVLMDRLPDGKEVYAVTLGAVAVRVLWKPDTAVVMTVLPWNTPRPGALRPYKHARGRPQEKRSSARQDMEDFR